jgi:hypothetical protein
MKHSEKIYPYRVRFLDEKFIECNMISLIFFLNLKFFLRLNLNFKPDYTKITKLYAKNLTFKATKRLNKNQTVLEPQYPKKGPKPRESNNKSKFFKINQFITPTSVCVPVHI